MRSKSNLPSCAHSLMPVNPHWSMRYSGKPLQWDWTVVSIYICWISFSMLTRLSPMIMLSSISITKSRLRATHIFCYIKAHVSNTVAMMLLISFKNLSNNAVKCLTSRRSFTPFGMLAPHWYPRLTTFVFRVCVEIPITCSRLMEPGVEMFLKLKVTGAFEQGS